MRNECVRRIQTLKTQNPKKKPNNPLKSHKLSAPKTLEKKNP
jgi:hypothetical protein